MSPYRRNILVGVVVLGALVFLGWMILKFGDRPAQIFAKPSMPIHFIGARADGVGDGSPILYQGVNVGRVTAVRRTSMSEVRMDAQVDVDPPLPANVEGRIIAQSLLGAGSAISLDIVGPQIQAAQTQPAAVPAAQPTGRLQAGATIVTRYIGVDLLPPQFASLADELQLAARQFRESNLVGHLDEQVVRTGEILEHVRTLVGDEKMREDLRQTLANVRAASESANRVGANLEKFSGELNNATTQASGTIAKANQTIEKTNQQIELLGRQTNERLTQVATLLDTFQSIFAKIDRGEGTAGALVNDPRLYQSLVDTTTELNATVADLRRLVEQWEQEGVHFKLSK